MRLDWILIAIRFALPLLLLDRAWGFHRDELLYSAMGDHLAWFTMQFPPLTALVSRLGHLAFGDSVLAARVPAAMVGAAFAGAMLWLVRRLGGGNFAAVVVWLASIAGPMWMRHASLLQPVGLDLLWSLLAVGGVMVAATVPSDARRAWLVVGIALGLGGLTKFTVPFYAVALIVSCLAIAPLREQLRSRWPWVAAGLALLIASPSLVGQIANDWPFFKSAAALRAHQLVHVSAGDYLGNQPLLMGLGFLVAIAGVLAARREVAARVAIGFAVVLLGQLLVLHGKDYYAAAAWPPLLVIGAVALERWTAQMSRPRLQLATRAALVIALVGGAAVLMPFAVPMLSPAGTIAYQQRLGMTNETNRGESLALPQDFADMLPWDDQARAASEVIATLSPAEQRDVLLIGANYGRAGALAVYRNRYHLPYPASTHGDWHAWGVPKVSGNIAVHLDSPNAGEGLKRYFTDVQLVRVLRDARAVTEEQTVAIFITRGLRYPLAESWRRSPAHWD